ncbi:rim15, signal transduction response regulator [Recurvomyces mirabilis]|uniref:non-specific serine/threonine protein kinase n=1 Tax=Recurvomyces mirabilis TaxID=574656 RepID=A0AAE0WPT7_9PEZI|nr:rim15, signal transduction response regulator [Recurvomyces mirabilis]KAK5152833.1 rim15, signal transduction response regulator [Recurvomyces mirabilis]
MAEDDVQTQAALAIPPVVAALRGAAGRDGADRTHMERTISMDIREEREDLKRAAEQSTNAILELGLDHSVKWVSPSWQDLTGMPAQDVIGKPIAELLAENTGVFADCIEAIRKDDSKSRILRFAVKAPESRVSGDAASADEKTPVEPKEMHYGPDPNTAEASSLGTTSPTEMEDVTQAMSNVEIGPSITQAEESAESQEVIELEAQGIMVYDRTTGEESHTMWMIKPAVSREITIDLPDVLVESLGIGAEMLANYLTLLAEVGAQDPENHPPPLPVLCRICERQITPWWFEKHTELCSQEHRAEMEVQLAQESLQEQRSALVKVLDALEAHARLSKSPPTDSGSPIPAPRAEYKGLPIGPSSLPTSNPSSGRSSPAMPPTRSRDSSSSGLSHHRARSFAVRRPLARIVELVLDLCDTTMEISTPSIKDSKSYAPGEMRTQSPQSEGRIQQVLQWQSPSASTLENEQGLALLCDETSQLARTKVEAVFRHRRILEYSERIRMEYEILVQECIDAAMQKAARIAAGDLSDDSSEDSSKYESADQEPRSALDEPGREAVVQSQVEEVVSVAPQRATGSPSSMAMALRKTSDFSLDRRTSSAGSSRASSPRGARTPKSYSGPTEPFLFHKRGSIAFESDTGADSDSSMRSSVHSAAGHGRADSPGAELSLSRVASTRSRERKRQSLVLPSLANLPRHQSPGRGPAPPHSPLRMAKPRIPSGAMDSLPSPITSPVLSTSEFASPVLRAQHQHHHRRQSSNALADALGRPSSPRLSAVVSNPQPRAVQTSIKDFEIIKPISKGAFGSVYLSKKKSTGDYYAIKVLKKADMIAKNQVTNVKAERAIMMWQGESDYVAKLYWTFSSKDYLYLVMEYLNGGDCASLVKSLGGLPEDWTKKYVGEILLCVQHLHSRQIVHRDLKPDNLLIDVKGHLKLTDFGLSRMGLIGRQKRAINAKPDDTPPDLLKAGPFRRPPSVASSRSTSFDFQGNSHSPAQTPSMTPAYIGDLQQPSYFSLNRETSREPSRRTSGHRSNSGDSEALESMFRRFSVADHSRTPIEEETASEGAESPDPYVLQPVQSNGSQPKTGTPPQQGMITMPPPIMSLFDPSDSDRRFVGTPDYLAPETIKGGGQDELSDWWSLGCILFEFLYGCPPFNADTPEEVFQNILDRNIHWPDDDDDYYASPDARDLMNKLMCTDPASRLGANQDDKYPNGGEEIKAHPWFVDINWDTLREDDASFVPVSENPEDTEYFDARGATMQNFQHEFLDEQSSPAQTPGADYPDRPHDALSRVRSQVNAVKRNLMPLHIPPHVRDARSRRLSEPVVADDFGNFQFKNLPVLEKANKDVIQKLRADAMQAQTKSGIAQGSSSPAVTSPPPAPSLEASPVLPMPLKRTLSANRGHNRSQSPSLLSHQSSSPSRGSQPSSPLLVHFSAQNHERRKTSSGSSSLSQQTSNTSLQPGNFFEATPRLSFKAHSNAPSPVKVMKPGSVSLPLPNSELVIEQGQSQSAVSSPRQRSHTVGSQDGDLVPELMPVRHKRRSGIMDISPSSSDNEDTRQKALLRVQRRRASSRRLSQVSLADGPSFRTLDVLICEDHPVSRLVMERLLEKLRCRAIVVNNGTEAMRYAMSNVKFDIIMMEYKLPHLNGADVARMIRDTKNANSHTPIVCVTGYLKELQGTHHFDALLEKPPTKEKLENVMSQLCQWKPASESYKGTAEPITVPSRDIEQPPADNSPTTTSSTGMSHTNTGSTWRSMSVNSREDSVSSLGDTDSQTGSMSIMINNRQSSLSEALARNFDEPGGLGITKRLTSPEMDSTSPPRSMPTLQHETSAPARLTTPAEPSLRKQPSQEAIQAKRRSFEKGRQESAAESGDDEDEELGNITVQRQRSPKRTSTKRTSKLGTEMMRTNSQGSVVSVEDVLAVQKESKNFSDELPAAFSIAEEPAAEVEASGRLTPPELFSPKTVGHHTELIDMDAATLPGPAEVDDRDVTPRPSVPSHASEIDPDPTPRASTSPLHHD